jgi:two-component system chemotaxis response regulator CheY
MTLKVLLVDDSTLSRKLLISRIPQNMRASSQIIQGSNGKEAVELYMEHSPDIVFLDLTMPVMDGYEALDRIIDHDQHALVYVITADIQKKAKQRVLAAGAAAIETKPIDEKRLARIFSFFNEGGDYDE